MPTRLASGALLCEQGVVRSLLATILLALLALPAHADPRTRRDVGIVLMAGGLVLAAVGVPLLAKGFVTDGSSSCAAWPMTTDVCSQQGRNLKIAGGVLMGTGLSVTIAGGVVFGVARGTSDVRAALP
jgi:hypothetical protein